MSLKYSLLALMFVSGLLIGAGVTGQYYQQTPVTVTEYETQTKTEYVAPDGYTVIQFTSKRPVEWPITVEFQTVNESATEWQTVYETRADRREPVAVPLNRSARYRITVTAADGERRILGNLYELRKDHYEIIIKSCCVDDFS